MDDHQSSSPVTAELLPCPFCTSEDVHECFGVGGTYLVSCASCEGQGPRAMNEETAKSAWNTRPLSPSSAGTADGPTLETRIRAKTRIPLIKIAAECHKSKWQFSHDEEETRLPAAEARRLVRAAFNVLHNIGDMAHKAAEELRSASGSDDPAQAASDPFMDAYKRDTIAGLFEKCAQVADIWAKEDAGPTDGEWLRGKRYGSEQAGQQIARAIRRMASAIPSTESNTQ